MGITYFILKIWENFAFCSGIYSNELPPRNSDSSEEAIHTPCHTVMYTQASIQFEKQEAKDNLGKQRKRHWGSEIQAKDIDLKEKKKIWLLEGCPERVSLDETRQAQRRQHKDSEHLGRAGFLKGAKDSSCESQYLSFSEAKRSFSTPNPELLYPKQGKGELCLKYPEYWEVCKEKKKKAIFSSQNKAVRCSFSSQDTVALHWETTKEIILRRRKPMYKRLMDKIVARL